MKNRKLETTLLIIGCVLSIASIIYSFYFKKQYNDYLDEGDNDTVLIVVKFVVLALLITSIFVKNQYVGIAMLIISVLSAELIGIVFGIIFFSFNSKKNDKEKRTMLVPYSQLTNFEKDSFKAIITDNQKMKMKLSIVLSVIYLSILTVILVTIFLKNGNYILDIPDKYIDKKTENGPHGPMAIFPSILVYGTICFIMVTFLFCVTITPFIICFLNIYYSVIALIRNKILDYTRVKIFGGIGLTIINFIVAKDVINQSYNFYNSQDKLYEKRV